MEALKELTTGKKKSINRLSKSSKIYKSVIKAIQDKKGEEIIILDLRKITEAVSDFFVICEASSTTQVKAIADNVEDYVKLQTGENPYRHEGKHGSHWVLIDYINIVIHVMQPEARKFYRLEELWSDAIAEKV